MYLPTKETKGEENKSKCLAQTFIMSSIIETQLKISINNNKSLTINTKVSVGIQMLLTIETQLRIIDTTTFHRTKEN